VVNQAARQKGCNMATRIDAPQAAPETVVSDSTEVSCDGGGALGHPRVYLNMGEAGEVECPYCDRKFILAKK
jgi:uncharacterized Zn-finger protein